MLLLMGALVNLFDIKMPMNNELCNKFSYSYKYNPSLPLLSPSGGQTTKQPPPLSTIN